MAESLFSISGENFKLLTFYLVRKTLFLETALLNPLLINSHLNNTEPLPTNSGLITLCMKRTEQSEWKWQQVCSQIGLWWKKAWVAFWLFQKLWLQHASDACSIDSSHLLRYEENRKHRAEVGGAVSVLSYLLNSISCFFQSPQTAEVGLTTPGKKSWMAKTGSELLNCNHFNTCIIW